MNYENQGRTNRQIKDSESMASMAIVGLTIMVIVLVMLGVG